MRLHLPKGLLAALLAACFASTVPLAEAHQTISSAKTENVTLTGDERLLFDGTGSTSARITYTGNITSDGTSHWCGPGNAAGTDAYNNTASYYIKLTGAISGSALLKFNDHAVAEGRNVVWELAGSNTYTGNFEVNHGGDPKSYAQLTLSGTFSGSNVVTLANSKTILHVASDVSLGGLLDAENKPVGAVTAIAGKTLTLNISGDAKTYSGSIGTGSYFTETAYTANAPTTVSAAVNLTKTGTGTQNLNGTNKFGTLKVDAGTLGLGGATTLTGATTVSSGATLSNTGNLTNNGSLAISGIYSGNTIKQEGSGTISLASGAVVNLDRLDIERVDLTDTDANGTHAYNRKYMLVSSGTATAASGVTYRIDGAAVDGTFSDGSYKLTATNTYYNIANGSVTYSDITAENQPTFDFIRVAGDGALVADGSISHDLVSSGGSVRVSGTGITYSGNMDLAQGTNLTITKNDGVAAADVTINGSISGVGGLIISGGVTAKLNASNSFTGGITIKSGSTLKLSGADNKEYCGVGGNSVTVESGATFDLNGTHSLGRLPKVTLAGGTLENTNTGIATDRRQLDSITLTASSKISAIQDFGLIRDQYGAAELDLGTGNTLTKTGSATFYAATTTIKGTGTLKIEAGNFNFFSGANVLSDGVNVELAGGSLTVSGTGTTFTNNGTSTIFASKDGIVSGTITNSGTLKVAEVAGAEGKTVRFSGTISGGNIEASATTSIATLTGSGTLKTTAKTTTVTNASRFTGALEATGGQMNVSLATSTAKELVGLTADGGDINVTNALSLTVADVVISNDSTVGVYSGADTSAKGTLNVCGSDTNKCSLTIGSGATLNANLVVNLAILDFSGNALAMGSTLTLIANGTSELRGISALSAGQSLTLFTGVGRFSTSWDSAQATTDVVTVDAHEIFGNLAAGDYSLKYTGAAAGGKGGDVLLIANNPTPEPTTATLSLLALMGLAARRRRKA